MSDRNWLRLVKWERRRARQHERERVLRLIDELFTGYWSTLGKNGREKLQDLRAQVESGEDVPEVVSRSEVG